MAKQIINGRFLSQPVTGVQRYASEIVRALDRLIESSKSVAARQTFEIVAPVGANTELDLKQIPVRTWGGLSGHLWEQIELPRALQGDLLLNLANTGPLRVKRQIVTIHDASVFAAPSGYSTAFQLWYRFLLRQLCSRATHVVTDSTFSQNELVRYCGLERGRSTVIPLGGEHIVRIPSDASVLTRHGLEAQLYVLAAGSLNPNKNLVALRETAERLARHHVDLVVVGGANRRVFSAEGNPLAGSVKFVGYISDAELRALYERASCFVFPSKYEGFGLPPLEAMACGCPVVVSNAASLPEVCGQAALYVDPNNHREIADAVLSVIESASTQGDLREKGKAQAVKFTWERSAGEWLRLLDHLA